MFNERRRKRRDQCPNTLFVEWLTEWKEEAANRQLKTQHSYAKALHSLKKYPLTIYSGKECKLLEGFGDKICKQIDDRLEQYIADLGTGQTAKELLDSHRLSSLSSNPSGNSGRHLQTRARPVAKAAPSALKKARSADTCIGLDSGSDNEDGAFGSGLGLSDGTDTSNQPNTKRRRSAGSSGASAGGREYIPQKNSGAYALLVTLYQQQNDGGNVCFMTKKELMLRAQPLSTKSFTVPDPGSFYTAWSSMGTLLKKELVSRQCSPAQYRLTASGANLGRILLLADENTSSRLSPVLEKRKEAFNDDKRNSKKARSSDNLGSLLTADAEIGSSRNYPNDGTLTVVTKPQVSFGNKEQNVRYKCIASDEEESLPDVSKKLGDNFSSENERGVDFVLHSEGLPFAYVDESGEENLWKDKAVVCIDDEISVGFLVKAKYEDLLISGKRYKLDNARSMCDGFVFAFLSDEDAPTTATILWKNKISEAGKNFKSSTDVSKFSDGRESTKTVSNVGLNGAASFHGQKTRPKFSFKPAAAVGKVTTNSWDGFSSGNITDVAKTSRVIQNISSSDTRIGLNQDDSQSLNSQSSVASSAELGEPDLVFPPGTFDVVLYVDNHEYFRGGNNNDEMLIREFDRNRVRYKVTNLHLGDFLWVAKRRSNDGSNDDRNQTLILDYIIERKRMDDLASSIIDGRFKEQKFRLSGCGISNPIYLVENYGSMQHFSIPEDSLNQAIINTQVVEGFFVKRTRDTKDTASYLTLMTRYLESMYRNKTLFGYLCQFKRGQTQTVFPNEAKLMVFDDFNEASVKSKALTVSEMFAKHLMQLHGLTAEKATAILQLFPTPKSLYRAYRSCTCEKERDELLANVKYGMAKRNIGKQLSKSIAVLYFSSGQLK